jgi:Beta-lactamase
LGAAAVQSKLYRLVDQGLLSYDAPVADYWPQFGANGKSDITVRDVLRHRSGLSHPKGVSNHESLDHHSMEERLAAAPVDYLRGAPAYHAMTDGWLLFWSSKNAIPVLGAGAWLDGQAEAVARPEHRCADAVPSRLSRIADFAFVHNRLLTPMLFDMASFAALAQPIRNATTAARHNGALKVPRFGASYSERGRRSAAPKKPVAGRR